MIIRSFCILLGEASLLCSLPLLVWFLIYLIPRLRV
jgi:hypothetical protein